MRPSAEQSEAVFVTTFCSQFGQKQSVGTNQNAQILL
jgi:hypothetical protein